MYRLTATRFGLGGVWTELCILYYQNSSMNFKKIIATVIVAMAFIMPSFCQQTDQSLIPYRKGALWGYVHADKSMAIKPAFSEANWFVAGFAVVKKGNKYGYINQQGKVVIPFKFFSAKPFTYGYFDDEEKHAAAGKIVKNQDTVLFAGAALTANGAEVCIDTKGRTMSKCPAINENIAGNNQPIVSVAEQKVYSMVSSGNLYDKIVDDYKLADSNSTYYIGVKNNLYGVISNTQEVILPFEYTSIKKVETGGTVYLQVLKNEKYGMYTDNGTAFIPVENNKLQYIKTNEGKTYFLIAKNGMAALKDISQQEIIAAKYADIQYQENRGFVLTGSDNLKGYYFLNNKLVAPKYSEIRSVRGGNYLLVKTTGDKMGFVNEEGVEFFED
jgi:WG containing repeat